MPRIALHTLGCKLNHAETAAIGRQFQERGFELVDFGQQAEVCVINTCTVTERADRECRQIIRRALRSSTNPYVIVTGCYAQLEPEEIASIEGVDLVLGSQEKFEVFRHLDSLAKEGTPRLRISEPDESWGFGPGYSGAESGRTRAYLKVQDGCDYSCSFCTIPLARGVSRSQPLEECLSQARHLVETGHKEVVLTGVNVGDYGRKLDQDLLTLVREMVRLEGLHRLRISSIEPNLLTDELIDCVASSRVLCRHFHIPLQSGQDDVLRRMRRRYTTRAYAGRIARIRERIPGAGIGVDVIVGFPGETDAEFEETYRFLNELPVSYLHVFTYSERPNTPASREAHRVEPPVRQERNRRLRILSQKKRHAFYHSMVGSVLSVLTESDVRDGLRIGLADNYLRVGVPAESVGENQGTVVEPVSVT
jgi:threonylcarbamoyladenosine tRNA methylthiotransferase MtaB